MPDDNFPILGKAEILSKDVQYKGSPSEEPIIWDDEEARERLLPQFDNLIRKVKDIPVELRLKNSVFFSVDLDYKFLAKSYYPKTYFDHSDWELAGSIKIIQKERDGKKLDRGRPSRRLFFRSTINSLEQSYTRLLQRDIISNEDLKGPRRIYSIDTQDIESKLINIHNLKSDILELIIHPMSDRDWQEIQSKLYEVIGHEQYPRHLFNWVMGGDFNNMPRFVPIQATKDQLPRIASFNPVRALRPMPGVSYPRVAYNKSFESAPPPVPDPLRSGPRPSVGVFDGGVDINIPHLRHWVIPHDITTAPHHPDYLEHGTGVCGAVLYGHTPNESCPQPLFNVKSFRVLPPPQLPNIPQEIALYQLVKMIESVVKDPANSDIKAYVLSFGPNNPIEDEEVDLFTSTLDRLAFENDIIFVVAVGNEGELPAPLNRIQPPADAVNGLGVGAYILDENGNPIRAPYSCSGPGRTGNAIKPDIHMFGGHATQPFYILKAGGGGECADSMGTSFSAPLACSYAGHLLYRTDDFDSLTPQTAKALLIHKSFRDGWDPNLGWGPLTLSVEDIMRCDQHHVTLLYNGLLPLKRRTLLQVPFFDEFGVRGKVRISWTLVYATDISPSMPDEYTLGGAEVTFRPNSDIFTYTYDKKQKRINRATHPKEYEDLIRNKTIDPDSKLPHTEAPYQKHLFLTEEQRRDAGVWDTAKHFWTKRKYFSSLKNPVIDIHAQARADWYYDPARPHHLKYACVVSLEVSDSNIQLYQKILERIPELVPIRLRSRARIRM